MLPGGERDTAETDGEQAQERQGQRPSGRLPGKLGLAAKHHPPSRSGPVASQCALPGSHDNGTVATHRSSLLHMHRRYRDPRWAARCSARGRALTRLRLKVFQVHFILILVDVLVSAHHHNGKFKLKDRRALLRELRSQANAHLWPKSQLLPEPRFLSAARTSLPSAQGAYLLELLFLDVQQTLNPLHDFSEVLALRTVKDTCAHSPACGPHGRQQSSASAQRAGAAARSPQHRGRWVLDLAARPSPGVSSAETEPRTSRTLPCGSAPR